jgi:hypothetical protein
MLALAVACYVRPVERAIDEQDETEPSENGHE